MTWLYQGKELVDSDIPPKSGGFIYLITHKKSGKRYLGRKLLTKASRRQKNKKIIKTRVESDWRTYWSSSPELQEEVDRLGEDQYTREILIFAKMRGELNYLEERFLYSLGVLEKDGWYNSNIRSKMYRRNVYGKVNHSEIESILDRVKGVL